MQSKPTWFAQLYWTFNVYATARKENSSEQAAALILAWTYPLCLLTSIAMFEGKQEIECF